MNFFTLKLVLKKKTNYKSGYGQNRFYKMVIVSGYTNQVDKIWFGYGY
jgi:hypothetical protein